MEFKNSNDELINDLIDVINVNIQKHRKYNDINEGTSGIVSLGADSINNLRSMRSSLRGIVKESNNNPYQATWIDDYFTREISAITRFLTQLAGIDSVEIFYSRLSEKEEEIKSSLSYFKKIQEESILTRKENDLHLSRFNAVDEIYNKTKIVSEEFFKDYEKINFYAKKIESQQARIEELEAKYRKSLMDLSLEEDSFKKQMALVERGSQFASKLMTNLSSYDESSILLKDKIEGLEGTADKLDTNIMALDDYLTNRKGVIDTTLHKVSEVLGSVTDVSLGGHFKEQYDKSKEGSIYWALAAGAFLLGAIILCLVAVFSSSNNGVGNNLELHYIISRILISPLFLVGAWFCANQYVKQKNIIEDYAYKKVLSLSLLSIKSEIEKTGEVNTTEFIRAVQSEIMKSPLDSLDRKHISNEVKLLKGIQNQAVKNIMSSMKAVQKKAPKDKVVKEEQSSK
ncbi:hypothetical protein [Pantoea agglomerans]|uniref:hypothetical protein n=1 Tax=Enterobacter agglomerans TaxID=549 RepID=UPI003208BC85